MAVVRKYARDVENPGAPGRIASEPMGTPADADSKVPFACEHLGRRVDRKVLDWDLSLNGAAGEWAATPVLLRRHNWGGWLLLMELDGDNQPIRKYTWGLDLAGLSGAGAAGGPGPGRAASMLEGAGGIGGLLAVYDTNGTTTGANPEADDMSYAYLYNASGDVGQVVDPNGPPPSLGDPNSALRARYEYDPYGGVTALSGSYADRNAIRFSTKPFDPVTGQGYWIFRPYDPKMGRWVTRDPAGELVGSNLARYAGNGPSSRIDGLGLIECDGATDYTTWSEGNTFGTYIYTCGCGWLDNQHVRMWNRMFWRVRDAAQAARAANPGGPITLTLVARSVVRIFGIQIADLTVTEAYTLEAHRLPRFVASTADEELDELIGAAIFDLSVRAEQSQNAFFWQGFSGEDLPSNFLALRLGVDGIRFGSPEMRAWIEAHCGVIVEGDRARRLCRCCQPSKVRVWSPNGWGASARPHRCFAANEFGCNFDADDAYVLKFRPFREVPLWDPGQAVGIGGAAGPAGQTVSTWD